jgi:phage terminase small subunit
MPRKSNLNTRQRKFVAAVAQGETYAGAYRSAGYADGGKPVTTRRNAQRLAKNAKVRASIEEMRLELLPQPKDLRAINEHAMAVIVRLSVEAEEEKVKLAAAQWLHEETAKQIAERERLEKIQQQRPVRRESDQEIIAELRALYAKALGKRQPELLETVSDWTADGLSGEAAAENLPQVPRPLAEVAVEAGAVCGEDEAPEPREPATVEVSLVAEELNPPVQYRMERIPGYFPARYRRVPIER